MWNYQTKTKILKAQGGKEIKIQGQTIRVIQYLSAKLRKRRKEYLPISHWTKRGLNLIPSSVVGMEGNAKDGIHKC